MGSGWTKLMAAGIAVAAASCSILLGIASSPASVPARGDSVVVSDREALMRAIDRAQPGSTILLAPADYGAVTIRRASFERPIKLKSLRPTQPARFTAIKITNSRGLEFEDLLFYADPVAERRSRMLIDIDNSSRLRFEAIKLTRDRKSTRLNSSH